MRSNLARVSDWSRLARQHGYRVGQVGLRLGVSRFWLGLFLRKRFGMAPHRLFALWRGQEVRRLAALGTSAKEIADRVGFANSANLSRSLKSGFEVSDRARHVDKMTTERTFQ